MTMRNKTLLAAACAAALMGFGAAAQAQYSAVVSVAPPPPRHEIVPGPREGFVWAPGHYEWRHGEYVWLEGHWLPERVGYEYHEPRWVQRGNGEWVLVGGNWEHRMDRDHWDRHADRDRWERRHEREAARDRDWDGDGVPDRLDRFPRNPHRS
jgi:hypothetical protein